METYTKYIQLHSTKFSEQLLLQKNHFFKRGTILEQLTFSEQILFENSFLFWKAILHRIYFFRRAFFQNSKFSKEIHFHHILFQKRYFFKATCFFHSYKYYLSISNFMNLTPVTQSAITYSQLTIETLEQGVKYVQS